MKYNLSNITEWPLFPELEKFGADVTQAKAIEWKNANFTHAPAPQVRITSVGARYIKLATFELNRTWKAASVFCFVDLTNGDILKGSWKSPVRDGVRGNLKDKDILSKVTTYGPVYLVGGGGFNTVANILKNASVTV
jgi:hypothetical protein